MNQMLQPSTRSYSHIVNVRAGISLDRLQNWPYSTYEGSTCVLQTEGNSYSFVETVVGHERGEPSVLRRDEKLPVPRFSVEGTDK